MWRSILSTRCYLTQSWKNLHNKVISSSSRVLYKSESPSNLTNPVKFPHQNHIFMCYSSVTESETESHGPTSSSEDFDLDVEDCSVDVGNGMKVMALHGDKKLDKVISFFVRVDEFLERKLDAMNLNVDEKFVIKVLTASHVSGEDSIRFFKWIRGKNEFVVTTSVLDVLAREICETPERKYVYARDIGINPKRNAFNCHIWEKLESKNVNALWDLVKEIGEKEKGIVKTSVLNKLISGFSKLGEGKAAFEVFEKFEEFGCVHNSDTYCLTIEALCKCAFFDWAVLVCKKMLDAGMLPESDKVCDIIMLLCIGPGEKSAHAVYLTAKAEGKYPAQMAVNLLIGCLSKEDDTVYLAQEMLGDLCDDDRRFGINLFSQVICGLCRKKDIDGAKKLLLEMIEKGPVPNNAVFNTIVDCLSKDGDLDDAKEMLKVMESRGLKPDVYTYSVIMSGYAKRGAMEEACKVLEEAKKKNQKLSPVTFHTLIQGYCKLGEFDKAVKLLSEMKDYGVDASVDECDKMVQSLCLKDLDSKTTEKVLENLKQKGLHLPGISQVLKVVVSEDVVAKA